MAMSLPSQGEKFITTDAELNEQYGQIFKPDIEGEVVSVDEDEVTLWMEDGGEIVADEDQFDQYLEQGCLERQE